MRIALLALLLLLFLAQPAFASVGVSPASAVIEDMLRGGYAERYFVVSNPSPDPADIVISVEGQISGWVTAEPSSFTLDGHSFGTFRLIAQPPEDIPNGAYSGTVFVIARARPPPGFEEITGVSVSSAVAASISVEVSDYQIIKYNIDSVSLPDTEECRPIIMYINIRNTGNVRVNPRFVVDIIGPDGTTVQHHEETTAVVLPTQGALITLRIPYQMAQFGCIPQGRYRADMTAYAGDIVMGRSTTGFNIFPRGYLTLSGEILELLAPSNITLGEIVRIGAVFRNTGQLPIFAKPTVEVLSGPSLVDTVSGEAKEVGIGGTEKLTAYWKPSMPGKYTLRAIATFEGRSTAPVERQIDVLAPTWWFAVGIAAGAAIVAVGFYFRRREKKGAGYKRRR